MHSTDRLAEGIKIVNRQAMRYASRFYGWETVITYDDIVGYGMLGLAKALHAHDSTKGESFKNYVYRRVTGEILDGFRSIDILSRSERQKKR